MTPPKKFLLFLLGLGINLIPLTFTLPTQSAWAQMQQNLEADIERLLKQAQQQKQKRQLLQAIETLQQVRTLVQKVNDREKEAIIVYQIGLLYKSIGKPVEALEYYNQALPIMQEVDNPRGEAITLNNIGLVYYNTGQSIKALEYYNQALTIMQEIKDRRGTATVLNSIGVVFFRIGKPAEALKYFNQVLPIRKELRDRNGEAITLNSIGLSYNRLGKPVEALEYLDQALLIRKEAGNRNGEASTLGSIGLVHYTSGQFQQAVNYYNRALVILQEVDNQDEEAAILSNIALVYRDINQVEQAAITFEKSVNITLRMRGGFRRENRQAFVLTERGTALALSDLLIDLNQPERAYEWANLITTFDLADYFRLINAPVNNPQAQIALQQWKEKNEQVEFSRNQLKDNFSEQLSQRMRQLEAEAFQQAEQIINQFPEIAELLETKPIELSQLRANIPDNTAVIQPVLITGVENVPNRVAIFILTSKQLKVIRQDLNGQELQQLLTLYRTQLENRKDTNYIDTSGKLYEILIRPIEEEIEGIKPEQLAFITTGKLRYLPFETLYDSESDQYLIEKYPIRYLTRISSRSLSSTVREESSTSLKALAIANPQPTEKELLGTEVEAQSLIETFPESEAYLNSEATLDTFKTQAPRFSLLHLGTHGCFQAEGCPSLGMEENTLLFANNETYKIADAALLGLKNTELIFLSACQTAKEINTQDQSISGLAYIFERAGAKSVIASLWLAEDKASQEIVVNFYKNLEQGMNKTEAIQRAKLTQINRHPWFWSHFILIGN